MKVEDLTVRGSLHKVAFSGTVRRVVMIPLVGRLIDERVCWCTYDSVVDTTSARRLAVGWALAARSPYTIVYFPMSRPATKAGVVRDPFGGRAPDLFADLDLVLLHHRLGMRPSAWKEVRSRLGAGHPTSIQLPRTAFEVPDEPDWSRSRAGYPDDLDPIRPDVVADTLVLTGSRTAFGRDLDNMRTLVEELPADYANHISRGVEQCMCVEVAARLIHVQWKPAWPDA